MKFRYIAVDFNKRSLNENIPTLAQHYPTIQCGGICATFDAALARFQRDKSAHTNKAQFHVWSFGSTLSNAPPEEAARCFEGWIGIAGSLWIGQDSTQDDQKLCKHYQSDSFAAFVRYGLDTTGACDGKICLTSEEWSDAITEQHNGVICYEKYLSYACAEGWRTLTVFCSHKYTEAQMKDAADSAGAKVVTFWRTGDAGQ